MNKNLFAIVAVVVVAFSLFTFSCTKSEVTAQSTGEVEESYDGVIDFYNDLLAFSKKAYEPLDKIESVMEDSVEWIERDKVIAEKPLWQTVIFVHFKSLPEQKLTVPAAFSAEDKKIVEDSIALIKSNAKELIDTVAALKLYYSSEDYKDDKHQKIKDLAPKVEEMINAIYAASDEAINRAGFYADQAERKNLEKNPIGIYILNMRDMMDIVNKQCSILLKEDMLYKSRSGLTSAEEKAKLVAAHKEDIEKIENLSLELDNLSEQYKKQDTAALKEIYDSLVSEYEDFFKAYENYKGAVRKAVRDLKENGTHDNYVKIESGYNSIIDAHNSFINLYNGL